MFGRQRTGSVVCPSCGNLVGVNDDRCFTCGRWNPGLWGFTPILRRLGANFSFTDTVIAGCVALYVLTLLYSMPFGRSPMEMNGPLQLLAPNGAAQYSFGASGSSPVFGNGRWWTLLSAGWLHGGLIHILFAMMWIRQLGPVCEDIFGTSRTVIIYTAGSVVGFLLSSYVAYWAGVPTLTLGSSAPIFGLLGAMVHYGRQASSVVKRQATFYAIMLFVFGLFVRGVDNWAHAGGFAGGYLASFLLKPTSRETGNHLLMGIACLLATVAAILASLIVR